jgi:hypothetical protein
MCKRYDLVTRIAFGYGGVHTIAVLPLRYALELAKAAGNLVIELM